MPLFNRSRQSLAIDLGNNNTLVADKTAILLSQPSWIAFNTSNKSIKAVGEDAYRIDGKQPSGVKAVKPLRDGVIADHNSARLMIQEIVRHALPKQKKWFGFDTVISGVPLHTTNVERHAFMDALEQFPTGKRHLLPEPVAAAIGMGLDIHSPNGKLVMDIGGGITEIVVISLCGIATYRSVKIAGDTMDEAIQEYVRRKYDLLIGQKTAERLKIEAGAACHDPDHCPEPVTAEGRDLLRGIPGSVTISHFEISDILDPILSEMEREEVAKRGKPPKADKKLKGAK